MDKRMNVIPSIKQTLDPDVLNLIITKQNEYIP